jgi:hypothetical protein
LLAASAWLGFTWWQHHDAASGSRMAPRTRASLAVAARPQAASSAAVGVENAAPVQNVSAESASELLEKPAFPDPPTPRYKARSEGEWQGMLVDLATQPPCLDGAYCGLALACVARVCTACGQDSDCNGAEVCVLDHCLLADQVSCRSTRECPTDSVCILSGYSSDPRGNAAMNASCVSRHGGTDWRPDSPEEKAQIPDQPRRRVAFDSELERARALRARATNPQ